MLLTPKRWKHRKQFRPSLKWAATRWNTIAFGDYGLKATESGVITARQIEAARKVIVRHTRKTGQLDIQGKLDSFGLEYFQILLLQRKV